MIEMQNTMKSGNEPLVSIIVPVYKVEKYLDRCVQSIISQTYKNIEVFLVDDGSPDNCGKMCDEYAEKYSFIHVIHQANAGQAAARNNAVKMSTGNYILFVDSDDYITKDHVEYLTNLLYNNNCDIAIGGFKYQYENKEIVSKEEKKSVVVLNSGEALERMNYGRGFGATPWAKLMPRKMVLEHPFPQGKIYEDLATMYKIIGDSSKVVYGERIIYYWVQRLNSTTRSKFDERQMFGITAAREQIEYIKLRYPEVLASAKARYTAKIVELVGIALKSDTKKESFKLVRTEMKYSRSFLANRNVRLSQKLRCIAVILGYIPSRYIFLVHELLKEKVV